MSSDQKRVFLQLGLFITTFITTTIAGAQWVYSKSLFTRDYTWIFTWQDFLNGMEFSVPFLLILTVHEFGHYFMARYHKVRVSLPYYIPVPPEVIPLSIGTFGAVIRIREKVYSKKQNFDIGLAGPLAGFVVALVVLFYGYATLPEPEYVFQFHPEYEQYGLNYPDHVYENPKSGTVDIVFGKNLLILFFENYVADPSRIPNPRELMHYPTLFAGFLALVFTFLNLFPVGQLDGGHVVYGLFGYRIHKIIASIFFIALLVYSGLGIFTLKDENLIWWIVGSIIFLYYALTGFGLSSRDTFMYAMIIFTVILLGIWQFPSLKGYSGWLAFVFIIGRFVRIEHPPSEIEEPLDFKRTLLGWLALIIFVICFMPAPLGITLVE